MVQWLACRIDNQKAPIKIPLADPKPPVTHSFVCSTSVLGMKINCLVEVMITRLSGTCTNIIYSTVLF